MCPRNTEAPNQDSKTGRCRSQDQIDKIRASSTGCQGRGPIGATAPLPRTRSRWSLDFVKNFTMFQLSSTETPLQRSKIAHHPAPDAYVQVVLHDPGTNVSGCLSAGRDRIGAAFPKITRAHAEISALPTPSGQQLNYCRSSENGVRQYNCRTNGVFFRNSSDQRERVLAGGAAAPTRPRPCGPAMPVSYSD